MTTEPQPAKRTKKSRFTDEEDTSCGFGSWRPEWLQRYASAKYFAINFSIVGILQGALFTYMVGIISTLEKRYAFESAISGFILIADNLSGMVASPIVGYLGSKYNRSTIIGIGEFIVAFAAIMNIIPYYMYGAGTHLLTRDFAGLANTTGTSKFEMCNPLNAESCIEGAHATVIPAVVILWFSSFANGLGYTAFYTIGVPYIDDNIPKKNSAMYISAIAALRLCGPTLGFLLSSFCLSFYENPFYDPGITRDDPRWIGAWWLGFIILGGLMILFSIPMLMFPLKFKEITKKTTTDETSETRIVMKVAAKKKFDSVWKSLKRLSTNYVLLFHVWGSVFRIIGILGYYIIKPKYMELQYRQSASSASLFTGATGVITMVIGTLGGGLFIKWFKPKARHLAICIVLVELFSTVGILVAMFLNCPTPQYAMLPGDPMTCNAGCQCSTKNYKPMCGPDGVTNYFSPCFAGCSSFETINGKEQFSQCSCVSGGSGSGSLSQNSPHLLSNYITSGRCVNDCGNKFPIYITVLGVCNLIAATARTGDTILTMRAVEPRDKSFAMGVTGMIFSVFAFIPYPLIFGAIIDSTCKVWEKTCGKTGNCWLYDMDKFRIYLHGGALGFICIGIAFEIGMVIFANRIKNLYDDEEEEEAETEEDGVKMKNARAKEMVADENANTFTPIELNAAVGGEEHQIENGKTG